MLRIIRTIIIMSCIVSCRTYVPIAKITHETDLLYEAAESMVNYTILKNPNMSSDDKFNTYKSQISDHYSNIIRMLTRRYTLNIDTVETSVVNSREVDMIRIINYICSFILILCLIPNRFILKFLNYKDKFFFKLKIYKKNSRYVQKEIVNSEDDQN